MRPALRWASVVALCLAGCTAGGQHPDVVLILIDTLRPDRLGVYGHETETAPYLAELARDAAVFERAFSTSSWTAPATASLLTGLYPARHGVTEGLFVHELRLREQEDADDAVLTVNRIPDDVVSLPALLRAHGYRSYGIATNRNIGSSLGFDRGFDHFELIAEAPAERVLEQLRGMRSELLDSQRPYFLYLHLNDPHAPYVPRQPWFQATSDVRQTLRSAYDSNISYLDEHLRQIGALLGWNEETVLAVASDHGEEFWEHGRHGHRYGLYQELNRVVLMFRGPGVTPGRIQENVSLIDVLPTLAELAGVEGCADCDGRSLVGLMSGDEAARESFRARPLYAHRAKHGSERGRHVWAAIHGSWKLIEDDGSGELYDHGRDPQETENRITRDPDRTGAMHRLIEEFRRDVVGSPAPTVDIELDPETVEKLRELGYTTEDDG